MAKKRKKSPFKLPETAPLPRKNPRRYGDYDMELMPKPFAGGYTAQERNKVQSQELMLNEALKRYAEDLWWMKQVNPFMSLREQI